MEQFLPPRPSTECANYVHVGTWHRVPGENQRVPECAESRGAVSAQELVHHGAWRERCLVEQARSLSAQAQRAQSDGEKRSAGLSQVENAAVRQQPQLLSGMGARALTVDMKEFTELFKYLGLCASSLVARLFCHQATHELRDQEQCARARHSLIAHVCWGFLSASYQLSTENGAPIGRDPLRMTKSDLTHLFGKHANSGVGNADGEMTWFEFKVTCPVLLSCRTKRQGCALGTDVPPVLQDLHVR